MFISVIRPSRIVISSTANGLPLRKETPPMAPLTSPTRMSSPSAWYPSVSATDVGGTVDLAQRSAAVDAQHLMSGSRTAEQRLEVAVASGGQATRR